MTGMILHCGGARTDLATVMNVPTPEPTKTHYPLPHDVLYTMVRDELENADLSITNQEFALAREGDHFFGYLQLRSDKSDYSPVVGLRNAHDKRFPAGLVVGSSVFVCDNLAFSGEIQLFRKHTKNLVSDLQHGIPEKIEKIVALKREMDHRIHHYKRVKVKTPMADHFVMECYRNSIITKSQVANVAEEFRKPRHPEFLEGGHTAWTLFNAVTEFQKGRGIPDHRRTINLHKMMDYHTALPALAA